MGVGARIERSQRRFGELQERSGGRGTVVDVEMRVDPPGGAIGAKIAKLFGKEPGQQVQDHLRSFKQIMETGHLTRSDASFGLIRHPASPPARLPKRTTGGIA